MLKTQKLVAARNLSTNMHSYGENAKKVVGSNNKKLAEELSERIGREVKHSEIVAYFTNIINGVRCMPHNVRQALPQLLELDEEQTLRFNVLSLEQSYRYNQHLFPYGHLSGKLMENLEFNDFFKLCAENSGYHERDLLRGLGMEKEDISSFMTAREPLKEKILTRCMEKFEQADQELPESQRWYHRHVYRFDMEDENRPLVDTGLSFPQTLKALHQKAVEANQAQRTGRHDEPSPADANDSPVPSPSSPPPPAPPPKPPVTAVPVTRVRVPPPLKDQRVFAGKPVAFAIESTRETCALGAVYDACLEKNSGYTERQIAGMLGLPKGMSDIAMLKRGRLWLEPDTQKQLVELFDTDSKKAPHGKNGWFDAEDRLSLPVKPSLRTQLETAYAAVVPETLKKSEIMVG